MESHRTKKRQSSKPKSLPLLNFKGLQQTIEVSEFLKKRLQESCVIESIRQLVYGSHCQLLLEYRVRIHCIICLSHFHVESKLCDNQTSLPYLEQTTFFLMLIITEMRECEETLKNSCHYFSHPRNCVH